MSGCGAKQKVKTRRAPYYAMSRALVDKLDAVNEEALLGGRVLAGEREY
jgi:hypothetical protein